MVDTVQIRIGKRVKNLREKSKMKQKDVAEALNISVSAYAKLEAGDRGISSENCIALAELFGKSCDYILRGVEATNLDICAETCLEQSTIDALREKKKEHQYLHAKRNEMIKDATPAGFEGLRLFFELPAAMRYYLVEEYIINSFFAKHWLSDGLKEAVLMGISGITGEVTRSIETERLLGVWADPPNYDRKTAAFLASQAFSECFSEMFTDANLLRKLEVLSEEDIQAAIERGLLHE